MRFTSRWNGNAFLDKLNFKTSKIHSRGSTQLLMHLSLDLVVLIWNFTSRLSWEEQGA